MMWNENRRIFPAIEYVSGQWFMNRSDENFFVGNYDLLLSPCGSGETEQEAFERMLRNIEIYEQKLKEIRIEIQNHLEELKDEK